jgi:cardiolipin synthase
VLRNGIRVYSYPGMTHVKAAVYDGWACLGSANSDKISLQLNHEVNLGTSDPGTVVKLLQRIFHPDFKKSVELHDPFKLESRHHFAGLIADELF